MLELIVASRVQRARREGRMVEKWYDPQWMRLGELNLHPLEFLTLLEINRTRRARFGVLGAVQPEELGQVAVSELVIARGLVFRIREVVQYRREVGALLGLVAVVISERGKERHARDQRLVGLEKLVRPIGVVSAGVEESAKNTRNVAVNVVADAEDESHRIVSLGAALKFIPHDPRDLVLRSLSGSEISDHEEDQLLRLGGPGPNFSLSDSLRSQGHGVRVIVIGSEVGNRN